MTSHPQMSEHEMEKMKQDLSIINQRLDKIRYLKTLPNYIYVLLEQGFTFERILTVLTYVQDSIYRDDSILINVDAIKDPEHSYAPPVMSMSPLGIMTLSALRDNDDNSTLWSGLILMQDNINATKQYNVSFLVNEIGDSNLSKITYTAI